MKCLVLHWILVYENNWSWWTRCSVFCRCQTVKDLVLHRILSFFEDNWRWWIRYNSVVEDDIVMDESKKFFAWTIILLTDESGTVLRMSSYERSLSSWENPRNSFSGEIFCWLVDRGQFWGCPVTKHHSVMETSKKFFPWTISLSTCTDLTQTRAQNCSTQLRCTLLLRVYLPANYAPWNFTTKLIKYRRTRHALVFKFKDGNHRAPSPMNVVSGSQTVQKCATALRLALSQCRNYKFQAAVISILSVSGRPISNLNIKQLSRDFLSTRRARFSVMAPLMEMTDRNLFGCTPCANLLFVYPSWRWNLIKMYCRPKLRLCTVCGCLSRIKVCTSLPC